MANDIRVPKKGTNATSRRIAEAVDDQAWQEFRVSMKGKASQVKLDMLQEYYEYGPDGNHGHENSENVDADCDICIRVDNYIKALARGGQLWPGVSLEVAIQLGGIDKLPVRRG